MQILTHEKIDPALCGRPVRLGDGTAEVALTLSPQMAADAHGLVHGGFVFGAADYAGMLAVNAPTVVLGAASMKFLKPAVVGDRLTATARLVESSGKKHVVDVAVTRGEDLIMTAELTCFVPERHVLSAEGR